MKRAALAVVLAVIVNGCAVHGISFRQDNRLTFLTPNDRADVTLPFTIRWQVEDFEIGPGAGSFAVFVDRAPQPPGKPLDWLARDDNACRSTPACPDARWYAQRAVYPTTATSFTIDHLSTATDNRRDFHEITVVLIDPTGHRVADTSWTLSLQVNRNR